MRKTTDNLRIVRDILKKLSINLDMETKLDLLSGGEQALTAISLLFAVFIANPSPFCILDEVDAPLDDNNVDRFCSMVEEISEKVQTKFIIVTHNRMTMSRVDRLYGVTMPEEGISQIVSVELEEAVKYAE